MGSLLFFVEVFFTKRGQIGFLPENPVTGVTAVLYHTFLQGRVSHFVIRQVFILKTVAEESTPLVVDLCVNPEITRIAQAVSVPVVHAPQGVLNT